MLIKSGENEGVWEMNTTLEVSKFIRLLKKYKLSKQQKKLLGDKP